LPAGGRGPPPKHRALTKYRKKPEADAGAVDFNRTLDRPDPCVVAWMGEWGRAGDAILHGEGRPDLGQGS
jgi:hypothetical protein